MSYNYLQSGVDRYLNEQEALGKFTAEARQKMKTLQGRIFVKTSYDMGGGNTDHNHWYALDQNGNGVTLSQWAWPFDAMDENDIGPDDHIHKVKNWIVGQDDGHDHHFDFRKNQQEELGRKVIEDPMSAEDVNPNNVTPDLLEPKENLEK